MSIEAILGILLFIFGAGFSLKKYFEGSGRAKEKFRAQEEELEKQKQEIERRRQDAGEEDEELNNELDRIEKERRKIHEQAAKEMEGVTDEEIDSMDDGELAELVGGLLSA